MACFALPGELRERAPGKRCGMKARVGSPEEFRLRTASLSEPDISEVRLPEPGVTVSAVKQAAPGLPGWAAGGRADADEPRLEAALAVPISAVQSAIQQLVEQARGVARRHSEECSALRAEVARLAPGPLADRPRLSCPAPLAGESCVDTRQRPSSREAWGRAAAGSSRTEPTRLPAQAEVEESCAWPPRTGGSSRTTVLALEKAVDMPSRVSPEPPSPSSPARSPARREPPSPHGVTRQRSKAMMLMLSDHDLDQRKSTTANRGGLFPDVESMKAQVRDAVLTEEYNVANYYKDDGWVQQIARSSLFEYITLLIIGANALWIAVDVDENKATDPTKAPLIFQITDNFFCAYFFIEWLIRFAAFKYKSNCLRDRWFVFDSLLVALTVVDTWLMLLLFSFSDMSSGAGSFTVLRVFRLLRLTRVCRMLKLLHAVPELMILVRGMAAASRSVALTLVLLSGIIYVYSVVFRQVTDGTVIGEQYFRSIPAAMSTLLLRATLPDMADILEDTGDYHILLGALMLTFVLLATLTVLNMLVGVLVEVVSVVASVEREEIVVKDFKAIMLRLLEMTGADVNANSCISRSEFLHLLEVPQAVRMIADVGVDPVALLDYTDFIFESEAKELSFPEFFDVLLSLRGNNSATVKDVVNLRKFVSSAMASLSSGQGSFSHNNDTIFSGDCLTRTTRL